MTTPRGSIRGPIRLVIAAKQKWQCSVCDQLLPSAFEIDHTVALVDGGPDTIKNTSAMCPTCHAQKTQSEYITRSTSAQTKEREYDTREDTYKNGVATCQRCRKQRPATTPHTVCWAIENSASFNVKRTLAKFAFIAGN